MAAPPTLRGFSTLRALARGGARLHRVVERAQMATNGLAGGFFSEALTAAEMDLVTVALYDLDPNTYRVERGLSDWEETWYDACLPRPPAKILVTAAGSGREVAALIARGYEVDCFEPVAAFAERCAKVNADGTTLTCDYSAFCRAVLGDGGGPAAALAGREYAAVVLGWGSFTHVLSPAMQLDVVRAACGVAPSGPVLASFFTQAPGIADAQGRGARAGRAAGRALGRVRGAPPAPPRVRLFWHLGFTVGFAEDDLRQLADDVDRDLAWWPRPYGHATFAPRVDAGT